MGWRGRDVTQAVERKLTTIFSADVNGFSRLMDADEVATLDTLRDYRATMTGFIDRHRGRVVNTAGDGLLAEFGSVVEAVQCAAEIQTELQARNLSIPDERRMEFRIGINLGDVMVEGDDIFGEGVNVAARLQELATPGGISVAGTVFDQVRNKLTLGYVFEGERSVKNITEPVPVYRVELEPGAATDAEAARPRRQANRQDDGRQAQERLKFYRFAAGGGVIVAFLFLIDLLDESGNWWFQWPAVVVGFFVAIRSLKLIGAGHGAGSGWRHGPTSRRGDIPGDAVFAEDTTFRGRIGGNATVKPGVKLVLRGKIQGDLIIERDAVVELRGLIVGDVRNRGGHLEHRGRLKGSELHEDVGTADQVGQR